MRNRDIPNVLIQVYRSWESDNFDVVERKGRGHPDTIADAISEALQTHILSGSREAGSLLPYMYADKTLIVCGQTRPRWGGGEIDVPARVIVPCVVEPEQSVDEFSEVARSIFRRHVPLYPSDRLIVDVYRRAPSEHSLRTYRADASGAEDTCVAVAYSPLTDLDLAASLVESDLQEARQLCPAIGSDIKVLLTRTSQRIEAVLAVAFVASELASIREYQEAKRHVEAIATKSLSVDHKEIVIEVNPDDRYDLESVYLTVTGSSIEGGDCGVTGRGNRRNGTISPFRPTAIEAEAGKPVGNHPARTMNSVAQAIADSLSSLPGVLRAEVVVMAYVGSDVHRPRNVLVRIFGPRTPSRMAMLGRIQEIIGELNESF